MDNCATYSETLILHEVDIT